MHRQYEDWSTHKVFIFFSVNRVLNAPLKTFHIFYLQSKNHKHRQSLMWLLRFASGWERKCVTTLQKSSYSHFNVAVSVVNSYTLISAEAMLLPKQNAENTFYYRKYVRFPLKTHSTFCDNIKFINDKIRHTIFFQLSSLWSPSSTAAVRLTSNEIYILSFLLLHTLSKSCDKHINLLPPYILMCGMALHGIGIYSS